MITLKILNNVKKKQIEIGDTPELRNFVKNLEYSLFGINTQPTEELEGEKRDVATVGYDKDEAIPRPPITGSRLKKMTPPQLITRLPILLAHKQAGNNSNKLKNEIRQMIYSLYRSKNLSKTLYNHLINSI